MKISVEIDTTSVAPQDREILRAIRAALGVETKAKTAAKAAPATKAKAATKAAAPETKPETPATPEAPAEPETKPETPATPEGDPTSPFPPEADADRELVISAVRDTVKRLSASDPTCVATTKKYLADNGLARIGDMSAAQGKAFLAKLAESAGE